MLCLSLSAGTVSGFQSGPDGCPNGSWIALTPDEFSHYMVSPFKLSMEEGAAISGAILSVWAVAYGIKSIIRAVRENSAVGSGSGEEG